jgi:hypothetical protein
LNTVVGATAFLYGRSQRLKPEEAEASEGAAGTSSEKVLRLGTAALIAGVAGFLALGFEIAWFRIFALATFDRAPAFALLLSTYLAGIAAGSFLSETLSRRKHINPVTLAGAAMLVAGAISVYLPPLMADLSWRNIPVLMSAPAFFLTAGLLGSVLPLLWSVLGFGQQFGRPQRELDLSLQHRWINSGQPRDRIHFDGPLRHAGDLDSTGSDNGGHGLDCGPVS